MNKNQGAFCYPFFSNIFNGLKEKASLSINEIELDNLEILIDEIDIDGTKIDDISISFQKQNGSFTLITNSSLKVEREKLVNLLEEISGIDLFASYSFTDMQFKNIDHFVFESEKMEFNKNILKQFENQNKIINLSIKK